jgi:hypothetical protein
MIVFRETIGAFNAIGGWNASATGTERIEWSTNFNL